jgi:Trypsin-like peptidase domain/Colicin V production protein
VTGLDWIIVVFTVLMAVWGYAQGLIVGALSLAGFAVGAFLGSRLGPLLLARGSHSPYAPVFALTGAFLLGGIAASMLEVLGFRIRGVVGRRLGVLDGVGGAVLLACLGLAIAWVGGAVALQAPGAESLRRDIQRSKILGALNTALPPSGGLLHLLARFDPFPEITGGPSPDVAPPTSRIARDPQVRAAGRSVVRVLGNACGLAIEGSGWAAGSGLVVTNAHVVAGEDDTTVQLQGTGAHFDATAVWFDPRNDVAILRVPAIAGSPGLALDVNARVGTPGAILGFPENGPFTITPGRLGRTTAVLSEDAYGRGRINRTITALRGKVRSGDSGGPMVDGAGRVVTTVFAATVGGGTAGGYGVPDSIVRDALGRVNPSSSVSTGPCAR